MFYQFEKAVECVKSERKPSIYKPNLIVHLQDQDKEAEELANFTHPHPVYFSGGSVQDAYIFFLLQWQKRWVFRWGKKLNFEHVVQALENELNAFLEFLKAILISFLQEAEYLREEFDSLLGFSTENKLSGKPYWAIEKLTKPVIFVINNSGWSIRYSLLTTPLVPALCKGSKDLL